jgi:hypothetical protein
MRITKGTEPQLLLGLVPILPQHTLALVLDISVRIVEQPLRDSLCARLAFRFAELGLESQAIESAQAIQSDARIAATLADVAPLLSGPSKNASLEAALTKLARIENEKVRGELLIKLVPYLSEDLLSEALVVATDIKAGLWRVETLAGMSPFLREPLREEVLAGALTAARKIRRQKRRARALTCLAQYLSEELLAAAVQDALAIENEQSRVEAIHGLAPYMPLRLLESTLEPAREIEDDRWRVEALGRLALYLPAQSKRVLQKEALDTARGVTDELRRALSLAALAPLCSSPLKEALENEALSVARSIAVDSRRALALKEVASLLPASLRVHAMAEAKAAAERVIEQRRFQFGLKPDPTEDDLLRWYSSRYRETPARAKMPLTEEGLAREAEGAQAALRMLSSDEQMVILEELLHHFSESIRARSSADSRVVSTGFATASDPVVALSPYTPLTQNQIYYFWLEIGAPVRKSIEQTPVSLPVEHIPAEAHLKVALFAFREGIQTTPGADVGEIGLLPDGSVKVIRQPGQPPKTSSDPEVPQRRLLFPVRTLERQGVFHLRCNIYYEQILVQSRLISARVEQSTERKDDLFPKGIAKATRPFDRGFMLKPDAYEPALRSVLDYTLTHSIVPDHLCRLLPHNLSLMVDSNDDGTHNFYLLGEREFKSSASFDGHELQVLVDQARGVLRRISWGDERQWEGQAYRYAESSGLSQLKSDLISVAIRGYRFYFTVTKRLAAGAAGVNELARIMLRSSIVQIVSNRTARFVLPTALIYDYPLDTNAELDSYELCPAFIEAIGTDRLLEEHRCFKGDCPSRGADTIVCPSGFWGYRHRLGMPLSIADAPDVPPEIPVDDVIRLAVAVSTDPAFTLRSEHEHALSMLCKGLACDYASSRDETRELLRKTSPHVLYFYCHGGTAKGVPYIQVGPMGERGITPDNLLAWNVSWDVPRPLVFINGCHTMALEPEAAFEFVSGFVETANASGAIGTETTVFEPLACSFAEECLRRFFAGASIGDAVRGARLALLKAGNPLGLVYTPYVIAGLHLLERHSAA